MNSKIRNIALFVSTVFVLLSCAGESKTTPNKDKAEEMFQRVWELYRVPKYGLFSEYYPSSHRPDLTYFNDSTRQAQEVSYLWPMSGVFSSAVLMAAIEPEKYMVYVDSMVMAMERYYDTTRVPFGYQAYPVQFGKVDRYYDDNGLVGIDYIDSYLVTKNPHYLEKAKQVLTFILSGWDENFEGAVSWLEGVKDQKPACSNGKAMVLALKLYEATKDEYYLEVGKKFYHWIDKYLKDPERGVVWNSWLTTTSAVCPDRAHSTATPSVSSSTKRIILWYSSTSIRLLYMILPQLEIAAPLSPMTTILSILSPNMSLRVYIGLPLATTKRIPFSSSLSM